MKALRVTKRGAAVSDVPRPAANGEALIRVVRSGICNTDIEIARGYAGFFGTIGHEFVGIVEECEKADLVGKRIVGEINAGCGNCRRCLSGDPRHCPDRTVLGIHGRDGAHAEFLRLPIENLIVVPDTVTDVQAVFTEPLAAAFGIAENVQLTRGSRVAIVGDGKLGILCARSLSHLCDGLTIVGKHMDKIAIAERYGNVTGVLTGDTDDLLSEFDVVIEASGSASGLETALKLVRPQGKIVLKSTFHGNASINTARVVVDEISIIGSRCGRFVPALELLRTGTISVDDLVTDELPLAKGAEALEKASEHGVLKVLLTM